MANPDLSQDKNIYDTVIIGGGPAGYTAGIYTSRARMKTILLESPTISSQALVTDSIENYPGFPEGINGFTLLDSFKKQAKRFDLLSCTSHVSKIIKPSDIPGNIYEVKTEKENYRTYSVIIATGASPRELNIPGEKEFRGRGVSYCATCDGAMFRNKDIVVVGGGDTAIEEALFLTRFASKVTIIHRRDRLRATKILQERAFNNNKICFEWSSTAVKINGIKRVESIELTNIKTDESKTLSCEGVFIYIGLNPNTAVFKELLNMDDKGYIITNSIMGTSVERIFACGDCRQKKLRQIVNACGDGAVAAYSAQQYVDELKGIAYK